MTTEKDVTTKQKNSSHDIPERFRNWRVFLKIKNPKHRDKAGV